MNTRSAVQYSNQSGAKLYEVISHTYSIRARNNVAFGNFAQLQSINQSNNTSLLQ